MPAWTPKDDTFSPFDDDGELKDDIPQDLAQFLEKHSISKNFTVEVKQWKNEAYSGRPTIPLPIMEGVVPTYDAVVKTAGPAWYGYDVSWTPKGGKPRNEIYRIALVGPHWEDLYEEAQATRHKDKVEKEKKQAELDAIRQSKGLVVSAGQKEGTGLKDLLAGMKDLKELSGESGGGMVPMMMQMFMGMMNMQIESSRQNTQLMIALIQGRDNGSQVKEMFGLVREAFSLRDGLMPRDKSWIEDVVGALADNIGPLLGLFTRGAPPDDELSQKLNEGLAPTRERAQQDPAFLRNLVKHMDSKLGAKLTDQVLTGFLNVNRGGGKPADGSQAPQGGGQASEAASAPGAGQAGA